MKISTAVKRMRMRKRRVKTARRKTTSLAQSQRAARTRKGQSQRTNRAPADSSSWSGMTPL